ncbi:beta-ketoacyl-[acyl-carrier-protein] synthase II [Candidatus Endobugula sertula]|uniref:3-oxoacyl-[acyl-carrier-protein] synthase 2 n=1 Tax=Candidatus Endobugula sertula TaxID=62101 RepID=A0A1D2QU82_9GAMM|nr:beta-ketoacyl-[acyl-carrier-protein] synthase II [Candidatus Endobugula sertula]
MVSPVGNTVTDTWSAILNGKSGVEVISAFDTDAFTTTFSASVKDLPVGEYLAIKDARKMDPFIQYGMVAGIQAMQDSGVEVTDAIAPRFGTVIGSGIGGIGSIESGTKMIAERGPRKLSPFFVPGSIINMIAGNLSIKFGLRGPNLAVTTACTTGTHAIGLAARSIRYGETDLMLAGGAEMATTPLGLGGFSAARALSTRNDDPQAASRPWDKNRDGFVLGDGAGILVLEEYKHAKARGAKMYAELAGFGMSSDAYHITSPPSDGVGAALSMNHALNDAQMSVDDVQYINAHGTSTQVGDLAECLAIKSVFDDSVNQLAVSSTKSMIGHLLGAAGAVEAIFSVLAIRDQVAPPTINLDEPAENCDMNFVPHTAQEMKIDGVLSNSFGFGGTNGSLAFRRVD